MKEIRNDECVVSSPPHSVARMVVHKGNVRHSNEMSPDSYQKGILGGNGHQSVRFGRNLPA